MEGSPPGSSSRPVPKTPQDFKSKSNFFRNRANGAQTQPRRKIKNAYLDIKSTQGGRLTKMSPKTGLLPKKGLSPRNLFGGTPAVNKTGSSFAPATVQPTRSKLLPSLYTKTTEHVGRKPTAEYGSPLSQIALNTSALEEAQKTHRLRASSPDSPVPGDYPESDSEMKRPEDAAPAADSPPKTSSFTEMILNKFTSFKNKARAIPATPTPKPREQTRWEPYSRPSTVTKPQTTPYAVSPKSSIPSAVNRTTGHRLTTDEVVAKTDKFLSNLSRRKSEVERILAQNRTDELAIAKLERKGAIQERLEGEERVRRDQFLAEITAPSSNTVPAVNGSSSFLTEDTILDPPTEQEQPSTGVDLDLATAQQSTPTKTNLINENIISLDSDSEDERLYGTGLNDSKQAVAQQLDNAMDEDTEQPSDLGSYIDSDSGSDVEEIKSVVSSDHQSNDSDDVDVDVDVDVDDAMVEADDEYISSDESSDYSTGEDDTTGPIADYPAFPSQNPYGEFDTSLLVDVTGSDADTTSEIAQPLIQQLSEIPQAEELVTPALKAADKVLPEGYVSFEADYEEVPTEKDESFTGDGQDYERTAMESETGVESTIKDTTQETVNDSSMDNTVVLDVSFNAGEINGNAPTIVDDTVQSDVPTSRVTPPQQPDEVEEFPDYEDEYSDEEQAASVAYSNRISVSPSRSSSEQSVSIDRDLMNPLDIITEGDCCYNRYGRRIGKIDPEGYIEADFDGLVCGFMENEVFHRVVPVVDHENPENTTRDLTQDEADGARRPGDPRDINVQRTDEFVEEEEQEGIELHKGEHITPFAKKKRLHSTGGKDKSMYDTPQFNKLFPEATTPLEELDDYEDETELEENDVELADAEEQTEEEMSDLCESGEDYGSEMEEEQPIALNDNAPRIPKTTGGKDSSLFYTPKYQQLYDDVTPSSQKSAHEYSESSPNFDPITFDESLFEGAISTPPVLCSPMKTMPNEEISRRLMMSPEGKLALRPDEPENVSEVDETLAQKASEALEDITNTKEAIESEEVSDDEASTEIENKVKTGTSIGAGEAVLAGPTVEESVETATAQPEEPVEVSEAIEVKEIVQVEETVEAPEAVEAPETAEAPATAVVNPVEMDITREAGSLPEAENNTSADHTNNAKPTITYPDEMDYVLKQDASKAVDDGPQEIDSRPADEMDFVLKQDTSKPADDGNQETDSEPADEMDYVLKGNVSQAQDQMELSSDEELEEELEEEMDISDSCSEASEASDTSMISDLPDNFGADWLSRQGSGSAGTIPDPMNLDSDGVDQEEDSSASRVYDSGMSDSERDIPRPAEEVPSSPAPEDFGKEPYSPADVVGDATPQEPDPGSKSALDVAQSTGHESQSTGHESHSSTDVVGDATPQATDPGSQCTPEAEQSTGHESCPATDVEENTAQQEGPSSSPAPKDAHSPAKSHSPPPKAAKPLKSALRQPEDVGATDMSAVQLSLEQCREEMKQKQLQEEQEERDRQSQRRRVYDDVMAYPEWDLVFNEAQDRVLSSESLRCIADKRDSKSYHLAVTANEEVRTGKGLVHPPKGENEVQIMTSEELLLHIDADDLPHDYLLKCAIHSGLDQFDDWETMEVRMDELKRVQAHALQERINIDLGIEKKIRRLSTDPEAQPSEGTSEPISENLKMVDKILKHREEVRNYYDTFQLPDPRSKLIPLPPDELWKIAGLEKYVKPPAQKPKGSETPSGSETGPETSKPAGFEPAKFHWNGVVPSTVGNMDIAKEEVKESSTPLRGLGGMFGSYASPDKPATEPAAKPAPLENSTPRTPLAPAKLRVDFKSITATTSPGAMGASEEPKTSTPLRGVASLFGAVMKGATALTAAAPAASATPATPATPKGFSMGPAALRAAFRKHWTGSDNPAVTIQNATPSSGSTAPPPVPLDLSTPVAESKVQASVPPAAERPEDIPLPMSPSRSVHETEVSTMSVPPEGVPKKERSASPEVLESVTVANTLSTSGRYNLRSRSNSPLPPDPQEPRRGRSRSKTPLPQAAQAPPKTPKKAVASNTKSSKTATKKRTRPDAPEEPDVDAPPPSRTRRQKTRAEPEEHPQTKPAGRRRSNAIFAPATAVESEASGPTTRLRKTTPILAPVAEPTTPGGRKRKPETEPEDALPRTTRKRKVEKESTRSTQRSVQEAEPASEIVPAPSTVKRSTRSKRNATAEPESEASLPQEPTGSMRVTRSSKEPELETETEKAVRRSARVKRTN